MSDASVSPGALDLLRLLRDGRPRTRADLVEETGLTRTTLGLRIDALRDHGLIVPHGETVSTGGRPSVRIAFNPTARLVGAVDVGATSVRVALCDLAGAVLVSGRHEQDVAEGPEAVLAVASDGLRGLLAGLGRDDSDLVAIGVGVPGPVAHRTGRPSDPPIMPGWNDFDVPGELRRTLVDVPVLVDNDVNVMALGEQAVRRPVTEDMIFVKVATGIGAGIISDGRLRRGADGTAGDIGHVLIARAEGVPCRCGKTGCLEAVAGGPGVAAALRAAGEQAGTSADVGHLVRSGNLAAIRAVRQAGRDLGDVLSTCVSVVNPSVIAIGGQLAKVGEHLLAGIREVVYSRSTPLATEHLVIERAQGGDDVGVIGAAMLAIEHVLGPVRTDEEDAPPTVLPLAGGR